MPLFSQVGLLIPNTLLVPSTTQSGTSYTFTLTDAASITRFTSNSAVSATVPPNSSVAFPIGSVLDSAQWGTGQVTIVAGAGVTIRRPGTLASRAQYSPLSLIKIATDEWWLTGDTG